MIEELVIYANGLVACSICTNIADPKRIEEQVNRQNPTGLDYGWKISKNPLFSSGQPNPCPCEQQPATHKHYLMEC